MRLAGHLTALRAWCKQCLPGQRKPDMPRIVRMLRMRGSMVIRLRPCMRSNRYPLSSTPPPSTSEMALSICHTWLISFLFYEGAVQANAAPTGRLVKRPPRCNAVVVSAWSRFFGGTIGYHNALTGVHSGISRVA